MYRRAILRNGFAAVFIMGSVGIAEEPARPMLEAKGESAAQKERREKEIEEAKKIVEEATTAIDNAPKTDPLEESKRFEERADAWMTLGEFRKAYDDYNTAIVMQSPVGRRSPLPSRRLFEWRFIAAMKMGDYPRALTEVEALVESSIPPDPVAYAFLAIILARSPDEKVRDAARAKDVAEYAASIRKNPSDVQIVELSLAAAYSVNGDFVAAVIHQERAIKDMKEQGGEVPEDARLQLEAYKQRKEFPFPAQQKDEKVEQ